MCISFYIPSVVELDVPLAGVCKAGNQGAPFIFLGADWLYPSKLEIKRTVGVSFSGSAKMDSTERNNAHLLGILRI